METILLRIHNAHYGLHCESCSATATQLKNIGSFVVISRGTGIPLKISGYHRNLQPYTLAGGIDDLEREFRTATPRYVRRITTR